MNDKLNEKHCLAGNDLLRKICAAIGIDADKVGVSDLKINLVAFDVCKVNLNLNLDANSFPAIAQALQEYYCQVVKQSESC